MSLQQLTWVFQPLVFNTHYVNSFFLILKESTRSPSGRGRPRVRFYDEVTQLPWITEKCWLKQFWNGHISLKTQKPGSRSTAVPFHREMRSQVKLGTKLLKVTYPLSGCRQIKTRNLLFLVKYHRCVILLNSVVTYLLTHLVILRLFVGCRFNVVDFILDYIVKASREQHQSFSFKVDINH